MPLARYGLSNPSLTDIFIMPLSSSMYSDIISGKIFWVGILHDYFCQVFNRIFPIESGLSLPSSLTPINISPPL